MIDFIKLEVQGVPTDDWLSNSYLDFKNNLSKNTGEIFEKFEPEHYNGLKFFIFPAGSLRLQGSLHKYYNFLQKKNAPNQQTKELKDKGFNGNDFNLTQLKYVLNDLQSKKFLNIETAKISNIEFGVNIEIERETDLILMNLLMHKSKTFNKPKNYNLRQIEHSRFIIKCYNKANQYGMNKKIIRFELKYLKMQELNNLGINYLIDLVNSLNLSKLHNLLLKRWNEILLYDYSINEIELNRTQIKRIQDYKNPNYWYLLKSNRRNKPKKELEEITLYHSENIKTELKNLIDLKCKELNKNCETFNKLFKKV